MDGDASRQRQDQGVIHNYLASFVKDVTSDSVSSGGITTENGSFDPSTLGHPNHMQLNHGSEGTTHFVIQSITNADGQPYLAQNVDGRFYQTGFYQDSEVPASVTVAAYGNEGASLGYVSMSSAAARQYMSAATDSGGGIIYSTSDVPSSSTASAIRLPANRSTVRSSILVNRGASVTGVIPASLQITASQTIGAVVPEQQARMNAQASKGSAAAASSGGALMATDKRTTALKISSMAPPVQHSATPNSPLDKAPGVQPAAGGHKSLPVKLPTKAVPQPVKPNEQHGGARRAAGTNKQATAAASKGSLKTSKPAVSNPVALLNTGENSFQTVTIMPSPHVPAGEEQSVSYVLIVSQPHESIEGSGNSGQLLGTEVSVFNYKEGELHADSAPAASGSNGEKKLEDCDDDEEDDDEDEDDEDDEKDSQGGQLSGADSNVCTYCDYTSPKRYLLSRHMKTHSEDRPHKCSICDRAFKTQASLTNHINTHTGTRPHKCKDCDSAFTTSGELVRHMRYRHTFEKPHKCSEPGCDYSSVELSKLKRHVRSHTGERPYQCPSCQYASPDTYKLKRHLRIHTGEKPYGCDVCNARFTQSNSLKAHKLIHSGNKPVFQCELCPTTCGRKTDLKIHVQKLHARDKPLECKRCHKYFLDRYSYKLHLKTHDGEKCFQCGLCPYAATSERHLQAHMLNQHNRQKLYECTECAEAFRYRQLLRRHRIFAHGAEDFQPKERQFGCEECGKTFVMEGNYQRHLLFHDPDADCYNNEEFLAELTAIDEIGETLDDEEDESTDAAEGLGRKQHNGDDPSQLMMPDVQTEDVMLRRIVREVGGHRVVVMEVGPAAALLGNPDDGEAKRATLIPGALTRGAASSGSIALDYGLGRQGIVSSAASGGGGGGRGGGVELLSEGTVQQMLYTMVGADERHGSVSHAGNVVAMQIAVDAATACLNGKGDDRSAAHMAAGLLAEVGQPLAGDRDCGQLVYATAEDMAITVGSNCAEPQGRVSCHLGGATTMAETSLMTAVIGTHKTTDRNLQPLDRRMPPSRNDNRDPKRSKLDECFNFDDDAL